MSQGHLADENRSNSSHIQFKSLNRKRSTTLQPLTSINKENKLQEEEHEGVNEFQEGLPRAYSISSEIIPQTLVHPKEEGLGLSASNSSTLDKVHSHNSMISGLSKTSLNAPPQWSNVGFQSIFQGPRLRKSTASLKSHDLSLNETSSIRSNNTNNKNSSQPKKSSDSYSRESLRKEYSSIISGNNKNNNKYSSVNNTPHNNNTNNNNNDMQSVSSVELANKSMMVVPTQDRRRRSSIFSFTSSKDENKKGTPRRIFQKSSNKSSKVSVSNEAGEKSSINDYHRNRDSNLSSIPSDINLLSSNKGNNEYIDAGKRSRHNTSTSNSSNSNPFVKMTRKIFRTKSSNHIKDVAEPAIPNSLSKFLHSSVNRHRSPVQFIHSSTGGIIDSGKSVYSFNPAVSNNTHDAALMITQQDDALDAVNIGIIHDFLKNLPSLEANYKNFNTQELHVLCGNVWGIYCSIVIELFKNQRIWQIPVKVEDINRILRFYIVLRTTSKIALPHVKIINEIEEFIITSLYVFENQIVFNYNNEDTMNTPLKRLGIIWQVFYQEVFYDITTVLLPLESPLHRKSKISTHSSSSTNATITTTISNTNGISTASTSNKIGHNASPRRLSNPLNGTSSTITSLSVPTTLSSASTAKNASNSTVNSSSASSSRSGILTGANNKAKSSIDHILLKCFRDSIVLPYYENFIHSDDGVSKSFYMYILNEEEENGVTEQDKLTLLQCFGILSTVQGSDKHQQMMEDLLEGVRMSI